MGVDVTGQKRAGRHEIFRGGLLVAVQISVAVMIGIFAGRVPLLLIVVTFFGGLALWITCLRPDLALTLFFCALVWITEFTPIGNVDYFCISDVDIIQGLPPALNTFFLILFCIVMARTLFFEKRPLPVSLVGLGVYVVILFVSLLTGWFMNCDPIMLRVDFMGMLFPVLCFYLCVTVLNSRERIERLLMALLVVASVKACVLYVFYLVGRGWPYMSYRVATMDSSDLLVFITLVLIATHLLVRRDLRGGRACLVCVACIPMLLTIIFAYRRSQWVGLFVSMGLLGLGAAKSVRHRIVMGLIVALCVGSAIAAVAGLSEEKAERLVSRFTSIFDKNQDSNRYHLLESTQVLRDLSKSPVLGLGLGSFHSPLGLYEEDVVPTNVVHNTYLYIWMKMGLPGVVFFIWVAVLYARQVLRVHKKQLHNKMWGLLLPVAASSGLWFAMFLVGPVPWYLHLTFLIALFAAIGVSLILQTDRESTSLVEDLS